jgi:hypothetical protein
MFGRKKAEAGITRIDNPLLVAIRAADPGGPMTVHIDASQVNSGPEAGIILADIATHFAKALAFAGKAESEARALADIRSLLDAELDSPTTQVAGHLVGQGREHSNGH